MDEDFHVSVPLKLNAMAFFDAASGTDCTVRMEADLRDIRCSPGGFALDPSSNVTIDLIGRPVTEYYAEIASNMMRPLDRFPELEKHFRQHRLACWFNPQPRYKGLVIIAQLPEDVAFRSVLLNALLQGHTASIGFVARFGKEIGAPLPTPTEFQAGMEPIFFEAPTFYVYPAVN